jgi:hypothetical protein
MLQQAEQVRTVHECLQAVPWNGLQALVLTPLGHALPDGLISVPLADMPPSHLVVAWHKANPSPLIHWFRQIAGATYRSAPHDRLQPAPRPKLSGRHACGAFSISERTLSILIPRNVGTS